jgi:sigma-B regulation protein RsbQ
MNILLRNAVKLKGNSRRKTLILSHGYGCNQGMWRHLLPYLENDYNIVLFDHVGSGNSDYKSYDRIHYSSLHAYADDLIEICETLGVTNAVVMGHSVGATIGALAAIKRPDLVTGLVMICPSPCFINQPGYRGGFEKWEIDQLMELMEKDFFAWADYLTPIIMGRTSHDPLVSELNKWFCQIDRNIAKHFAQVTFYADHREEFKEITTPTLIIQCTADALAPVEVGRFIAENIQTSKIEELPASGHCPHVTVPENLFKLFDENADFISNAFQNLR